MTLSAIKHILLLAFLCVISVVGLGLGVIYVLNQLNPHLPYIIGWILVIGLVILFVYWCWHKIQHWRAIHRRDHFYARLAMYGDTMAYHTGGGIFEHLSAEHERAGVGIPKEEPVEEEEEPPGQEVQDYEIIDLHKKGISLRSIEKFLKDRGVGYSRAQRVIAYHKDQEAIDEYLRQREAVTSGASFIDPPPPPTEVVERVDRRKNRRSKRETASS